MNLHETIARRSAWLVCFAAVMSLTFAMGVGQLGADDSPKGTVDIKLKLVPSQPEVPAESQAETPQIESAKSEASPLPDQSEGDIELTLCSDNSGPLGLRDRLRGGRESTKPSVPRLRFEPATQAVLPAAQGKQKKVSAQVEANSAAPARIVDNRSPQRLANLPANSQASKLPTRERPELVKTPTEPSILDDGLPRVSSRRTTAAVDELEANPQDQANPQNNVESDEEDRDPRDADNSPEIGDVASAETVEGKGMDLTGSSMVEETEECPGAPGSPADLHAAEGAESVEQLELQKDDVPLVQDEHPYDAPAARPIVKQRDITSPAEQLSAADLQLRGKIQRVLTYYMDNPENTTRRGPWAIMHAALPFGVEGEIMAGNRRVNALGWMCYNGVCAKQRMFQPTKQGFRTNVGPGVQGHEGQFLAILAQSRVQPDYPILIGNRRYTIMDLAKYEMATCREKSELTFKLIGLSHYLENDQRWRDNQGRHWNLEKMVAEELAQPVIGSACGGTHRLMGLTFALVRRQQAGLPLTGHWNRAEVFINDFVNYAISLQNPDGSFSTNWFEGRGNEDDIERKLQTSGHTVEWLIFTLPDDQLRTPQIRKAIEFLAGTLDSNLKRDWPIGPRGHALRALALYHQRLYGGEPGQMRDVLTAGLKKSPSTR